MDGLVAPGQLVGQRLDDRYHLLRLLREDAVSEVYEADDERLERRVAVHVFDGDAPPDLGALGEQEPGGVLDAGEHDGRPYAVLPLVEGAVTVATGAGDDEPTEEVPLPSDHTAVLPVPLVPVPDPTGSVADPSPAPEPVRTVDTQVWSRRALLGAIAVILLIVLFFGLTAARDGIDVPAESTVPVTVETTTTTVAPTTTSPPTTQKPAHGKGKGGRKSED
jgi:hypothetical protein